MIWWAGSWTLMACSARSSQAESSEGLIASFLENPIWNLIISGICFGVLFFVFYLKPHNWDKSLHMQSLHRVICCSGLFTCIYLPFLSLNELKWTQIHWFYCCLMHNREPCFVISKKGRGCSREITWCFFFLMCSCWLETECNHNAIK